MGTGKIVINYQIIATEWLFVLPDRLHKCVSRGKQLLKIISTLYCVSMDIVWHYVFSVKPMTKSKMSSNQ